MRPGYAGSVNLVTAAWGVNLIAETASTISVLEWLRGSLVMRETQQWVRVGLDAAVSFSPKNRQKSAFGI